VKKTVDIVGVPIDLGAGRRGVDMGPSALRIADITRGVRDLGFEVHDLGDIRVPIPEIIGERDRRARFAAEIGEVCSALFALVRDSVLAGHTPISLGGDHSLAAGSIAGISAAMRQSGRPLGVLWVDAHADMNTPETTPSGNVHGMPLASLLGKGTPELVEIGTAKAHPPAKVTSDVRRRIFGVRLEQGSGTVP
jgi:arginase